MVKVIYAMPREGNRPEPIGRVSSDRAYVALRFHEGMLAEIGGRFRPFVLLAHGRLAEWPLIPPETTSQPPEAVVWAAPEGSRPDHRPVAWRGWLLAPDLVLLRPEVALETLAGLKPLQDGFVARAWPEPEGEPQAKAQPPTKAAGGQRISRRVRLGKKTRTQLELPGLDQESSGAPEYPDVPDRSRGKGREVSSDGYLLVPGQGGRTKKVRRWPRFSGPIVPLADGPTPERIRIRIRARLLRGLGPGAEAPAERDPDRPDHAWVRLDNGYSYRIPPEAFETIAKRRKGRKLEGLL